MFQAIVTSDIKPIRIKRVSDGAEFYNCQMLASGSACWKPMEKDYVMVDICDDDGLAYILGKIELSDAWAPAGVQIGDAANGNGIDVSTDGTFIKLQTGDSSAVMTDNGGLSLNLDSYEQKGHGYEKKIYAAEADSDIVSTVKTNEVTFAPSLLQEEWITTVVGEESGSITITQTLDGLPVAPGKSYSLTIKNDGTVTLIAGGAIKQQDIIDAAGMRRFGTGGASAAIPMVQLTELNALLSAITTLYNTHTHVAPPGGGATAVPLAANFFPATPLAGSMELFLTK
jgi:hypothetical protein